MNLTERFDTSTVLNRMFNGVSACISMSRGAFLEKLFYGYVEQEDCGVDLCDSSLVGRWFNGQAPLSPKIIEFYLQKGVEWLSDDIQDFVLPLFPDRFAVLEALQNLLIQDSTVSEQKKKELLDCSPCESGEKCAEFLAELLLFAVQRPFIKQTPSRKQLKSSGDCSPALREFVFGGEVPVPCKWFCGREQELVQLSELLEKENKVFLTGIPGIGKSEVAKAFASSSLRVHRTSFCLHETEEPKVQQPRRHHT